MGGPCAACRSRLVQAQTNFGVPNMHRKHLLDEVHCRVPPAATCRDMESPPLAARPVSAACAPKNTVLCKGPGCSGRQKPVDYCGRPKRRPRMSAKCKWFYKVGGWRPLTLPIDPRARAVWRGQEIRLKESVFCKVPGSAPRKNPWFAVVRRLRAFGPRQKHRPLSGCYLKQEQRGQPEEDEKPHGVGGEGQQNG